MFCCTCAAADVERIAVLVEVGDASVMREPQLGVAVSSHVGSSLHAVLVNVLLSDAELVGNRHSLAVDHLVYGGGIGPSRRASRRLLLLDDTVSSEDCGRVPAANCYTLLLDKPVARVRGEVSGPRHMSIIDSKSGDFGSLVEVVGGNLCALLGEGQGRHLLREWAEGEEGGEDAGESA